MFSFPGNPECILKLLHNHLEDPCCSSANQNISVLTSCKQLTPTLQPSIWGSGNSYHVVGKLILVVPWFPIEWEIWILKAPHLPHHRIQVSLSWPLVDTPDWRNLVPLAGSTYFLGWKKNHLGVWVFRRESIRRYKTPTYRTRVELGVVCFTNQQTRETPFCWEPM